MPSYIMKCLQEIQRLYIFISSRNLDPRDRMFLWNNNYQVLAVEEKGGQEGTNDIKLYLSTLSQSESSN